MQKESLLYLVSRESLWGASDSYQELSNFLYNFRCISDRAEWVHKEESSRPGSWEASEPPQNGLP